MVGGKGGVSRGGGGEAGAHQWLTRAFRRAAPTRAPRLSARRSRAALRGPTRLRVLVDEDERVGHVRVAHVHNSRTDPLAAHARLHFGEQAVHRVRDFGRVLHALQPLARVTQPVVMSVQQVLLCKRPQPARRGAARRRRGGGAQRAGTARAGQAEGEGSGGRRRGGNGGGRSEEGVGRRVVAGWRRAAHARATSRCARSSNGGSLPICAAAPDPCAGSLRRIPAPDPSRNGGQPPDMRQGPPPTWPAQRARRCEDRRLPPIGSGARARLPGARAPDSRALARRTLGRSRAGLSGAARAPPVELGHDLVPQPQALLDVRKLHRV